MKEDKVVNKKRTIILLIIFIAIGGLVLYGGNKGPKVTDYYETGR